MSRIQLSSLETADSSTHVHPVVGSVEPWLWGLVGVSLVLDVALTAYGLGLGLEEANPIARALFSMIGVIEAMLLLKGIVLALGIVAWVSLPRRYRAVVPIGIALPWLVASTINASLII
jgi:hypothetical protein